jgi:peptidoglycan/LPS O-acetylase OafA/YrhL
VTWTTLHHNLAVHRRALCYKKGRDGTLNTPITDKQDLIPSLDGLRAVAVLIVVVAHAGYGHFVPGGLGVTIFFFLSGYLITTLLLREYDSTGEIGIRNFYLRRLFRLFPPLLLILTIAYALTIAGLLQGGISVNGALAQIFYFANYYFLFFDPGNTTPQGTVVLWSLAVEEHFYIFYPLILTLLLSAPSRPRTIATIFAAACVAILAWRLHLVQTPGFVTERTYYASDTRIDSILYGCIFALAFNPMPAQGGSARASALTMSASDWGLLAAASALLLATLSTSNEVFRETVRYSAQGLALMPMFYYSIRHAFRFPFVILNGKWITKLGVYSYAIYLAHSIIISVLAYNAPWIVSRPPILFLAAFSISIAFAACVDKCIEPYFRLLRHKFRSRANRPHLAAAPMRQN